MTRGAGAGVTAALAALVLAPMLLQVLAESPETLARSALASPTAVHAAGR